MWEVCDKRTERLCAYAGRGEVVVHTLIIKSGLFTVRTPLGAKILEKKIKSEGRYSELKV